MQEERFAPPREYPTQPPRSIAKCCDEWAPRSCGGRQLRKVCYFFFAPCILFVVASTKEKQMEFRQLGHSGLKVPALCFGTGTLVEAMSSSKPGARPTSPRLV